MSTQQDRDNALHELACKIDKSPTPTTERSCQVTLPDGSTRLGLTQCVHYVHHGGEYAGALFCRVAFRFAGADSDLPNSYSPTHDVAWLIVDHRRGVVQFGPEGGLLVRQRGLGIGSYILGQLIRPLLGGQINGTYKVITSVLPEAAIASLPPEEVTENERRLERVLARSGFYLSSAAGTRVVGARRVSDLRASWNGEKVRFLNPGQLIDLAAGAVMSSSAAESKGLLLATKLSELQGETDRIAGALAAAQSKLDERVGFHTREVQAFQAREAEFNNEIQALKTIVQDLEGALQRGASSHQPQLAAAPVPVAAPSNSTMVIELGLSARRAVWATLGVLCVLGSAALLLLGSN